jgi:hypothetical protein
MRTSIRVCLVEKNGFFHIFIGKKTGPLVAHNEKICCIAWFTKQPTCTKKLAQEKCLDRPFLYAQALANANVGPLWLDAYEDVYLNLPLICIIFILSVYKIMGRLEICWTRKRMCINVIQFCGVFEWNSAFPLSFFWLNLVNKKMQPFGTFQNSFE